MRILPWINILLKISIIAIGSLVFFFPHWEQFQHKSIPLRFISFNILSFTILALWYLKGKKRPYPHVADILVGFPLFLDLFGNAVYLFWTGWYDKLVHGLNTFIYVIFFAALIISKTKSKPLLACLAAIGITSLVHLSWEAIEYALQFFAGKDFNLTYEDTLLDLLMGMLGSIIALLLANRIFSLKSVKDKLLGPLATLN